MGYLGSGNTSVDIGYTTTDYSSDTAGQASCLLKAATACINSASTVSSLRSSSSTKSCCTWTDGAPAPDGLYICVPGILQSGGSSYAQEYVDSFGSMMANATKDLIVGWYIIVIAAVVALIFSFIWTYILKASAACFVWSCVALSNICCIIATAACFFLYDSYSKAYDDNGLAADEQMKYL